MIAKLLQRLRGDETATLPADEARVAIAALLVIAAHADHDYADEEKAQIDRVLSARFGLDAAGATALRVEGEAAEAASLDLYKFTALIKAAIPHEERASVLEALWRVVLADGQREAHEDALMRRLADLLGLDSRDSAEARRLAMAR
jgi:uncharacterized tellurite resistance protein B-like protein